MKAKKVLLTTAIISSLFISCQKNAPVNVEGDAKLVLTVLGDTALTSDDSTYIALSNAKVTLSSEYGYTYGYTDDSGVLTLEGIPSSTYDISAKMTHPSVSTVLLSGSIDDVDIVSGNVVYDTIETEQISNTGIAINEIYACGPVNSIYFFYDQYIELYNNSGETKYLDGMMIARVGGEDLEGGDSDNDGDMDEMTYIYKFPGSPGETNYPFAADSFLVVATKAYDHRKSVSTSIDLSDADWEFYNQYSTSDFDNSDVPNLSNLNSSTTVDFLLNLVTDVVIVTDGTDDDWEDGIDIDTILDGVQYKSSITSKKTIDSRVDKGIIVSPAKYSGKSMQRVEPGEDTNNGTADWEIISSPTIGKQ